MLHVFLMLHLFSFLHLIQAAATSSGIPAIVTLLVPIVIGAVATPIYQFIKSLSTKIDGLPSWLHPILATIIAYGLTLIASAFHIQLSASSLGGLSLNDISALISGLFTVIAHQVWKTATGTANSSPPVAAAIASVTGAQKASP